MRNQQTKQSRMPNEHLVAVRVSREHSERALVQLRHQVLLEACQWMGKAATQERRLKTDAVCTFA